MFIDLRLWETTAEVPHEDIVAVRQISRAVTMVPAILSDVNSTLHLEDILEYRARNPGHARLEPQTQRNIIRERSPLGRSLLSQYDHVSDIVCR